MELMKLRPNSRRLELTRELFPIAAIIIIYCCNLLKDFHYYRLFGLPVFPVSVLAKVMSRFTVLDKSL